MRINMCRPYRTGWCEATWVHGSVHSPNAYPRLTDAMVSLDTPNGRVRRPAPARCDRLTRHDQKVAAHLASSRQPDPLTTHNSRAIGSTRRFRPGDLRSCLALQTGNHYEFPEPEPALTALLGDAGTTHTSCRGLGRPGTIRAFFPNLAARPGPSDDLLPIYHGYSNLLRINWLVIVEFSCLQELMILK